MPVPPNHLSPDQRLPGAVLRNDKMKNGEILTTEPNVEEAPFPDHHNNAPLVHVRSQSDQGSTSDYEAEAPQDLLGQDELSC